MSEDQRQVVAAHEVSFSAAGREKGKVLVPVGVVEAQLIEEETKELLF